jgi:hypothetical protein
MSEIASQVHGKFKLFTGTLGADKTIGELADEVEAWVRSAKVAPKSIGVEYLEGAGRLILTVGYRDDETPYQVKLTCASIGKVESLDAAGLSKLEQAMAAASGKLRSIICHELYITDDNDFLMVFMTHQAG